jgi:hypothetical protein
MSFTLNRPRTESRRTRQPAGRKNTTPRAPTSPDTIDLKEFPATRGTARPNFRADLRERGLAMATKTGICARE